MLASNETFDNVAREQQVMALSTAQYIALSAYLESELDRYVGHLPDFFPEAIVQAVKENFIDPYRP
ncbi:MAG: hypothetical protein AAFY11_03130 [Cyanobacteria bacterium J06641_5]